MLLHRIHSAQDPLCSLIQDDPVRPEIPLTHRVTAHSEIFALISDSGAPGAVVCVHYKNTVPSTVAELLDHAEGSVAVFYTIWSYLPRCGKELLTRTCAWIQEHKPSVTQFVTLSPHTEQARKFHINNGASVYRSNATSVNYIYA